jgi:dCTP deaminase
MEIEKQIESGKISITPFEKRLINPNSYNLRLYNELLTYADDVLDMKKPLGTKRTEIPPDGLVLMPGRLYLGRTFEHTATDHFVPMLEGRSSIGRLGLYIHVTAGFGDVGFSGYWTLEIQCVHPVKIYPMVEICQIYYHTIKGEFRRYGNGKYQNNTDIQPSMSYRDFERDETGGI